ncbi:MAG TPA: hypothetical protein VF105_14255 [Gemmatimonadaceae bacterium]
MTNRSNPDSRQKAEIIAAARLEIARRIARFCTSLAPVEFERLLDKMVHIHWKYDVLPDLDPTTIELKDRSDALEA